MLTTVLNTLRRIRVTALYAVILAAVAEVMLHLQPQSQQAVIRHTSTNLHNLGHGHLGTLLGSAFVNDAGPVYIWLPGLIALLALGELLWQSRRLVVAFAIGHLGATVIVAAGLAAAIAAGLLSSSLADAADVGMSYGAVAVLGTFTAAIPTRWRAVWGGWWIAVAGWAIIVGAGDFTNIGHGIALLLGMAVGSRFTEPGDWTPVRLALLTVAAGFGYLMIAYNDMSTSRAAVVGTAGALIGWAGSGLIRSGLSRGPQTNSSALDSIQSDSQVSGGDSSSSPGISHS